MSARAIVVEVTSSYVVITNGSVDLTEDHLYRLIERDDPVSEEISWHEPDPAETKAYADDIAYLLEEA